MTHDEVKSHMKPSQKCGPESQKLLRNFNRGNRANTVSNKQSCCHTLKALHRNHDCNCQRKQRINTNRLKAMQVQVKRGKALASQLQHLACKAGCTWDAELKQWMDLEALLQHPNPEIRERWQKSSTKEMGNIFQGHGETKGKNVCHFIFKHEIPCGEKVTHPWTAVDCRPEKIEPSSHSHHSRW